MNSIFEEQAASSHLPSPRSTTLRARFGFASIAMLLTACTVSLAQDARHVVEPHYPKTCFVLRAQLSAPKGVLTLSDEQRQDTIRLQQAIDSCAEGKAVELRADGDMNVFLAGPFHLKRGVTLLIDGKVALFSSRDPRDYDLTPGSCGILSEKGHGCKPFITVQDAPNSGIMGEGSIDGRGGAEMLGQKITWWELAHQAKVYDRQQNCMRLLHVDHSDNFTLYKITLRNSPNTHVSFGHTDGFTAWGVKILTPKTARNTDGIDPEAGARNVTIAWSAIHTGDDNIAIKSDPNGAASNISILHNHFYTGHGMSIGSQTSGGVNHVEVRDLTIDGADNGIRIKSDRSRGGLVEDILFQDVCIRNTPNPLVFVPMYTIFEGDRLPTFRRIVLRDVRVLTPGVFTFFGLDAVHELGISLDNVTSDDVKYSELRAKFARIVFTGAGSNLIFTGEDVSVSGAEASRPAPIACENRFVPVTAGSTAPQAAGRVLPEDKTLYVAADGTGDFYSIQRAIDVAPASGGAIILVAPGTYREVLTIDKPKIQLRSANRDASKTVIVYDRNATADGGTLNTATVNVSGDDFLAENITFQNDFKITRDPNITGSQAVALKVTGDRAIFRNVRLLGLQDTLYAGSKGCTGEGPSRNCAPARQYFSESYIEGHFDFIFGDGKTVFNHCEIHSVPLVSPLFDGFLTAQSKTYPAQDSGYLIYKSRLTAEPGIEHVWLGRPWRPYSAVTYIDTEMGAHIVQAGWREWLPGQTHSIDTATYSEFGSTGLGAHPGERDTHVKTLSAADAANYAPEIFLRGNDNWNPVKQEIPPLP
jgi:polygalacturonase